MVLVQAQSVHALKATFEIEHIHRHRISELPRFYALHQKLRVPFAPSPILFTNTVRVTPSVSLTRFSVAQTHDVA